jgi:uncharacterized protein (DUF58 family)
LASVAASGARQAEALGARLPPLLVAAERVAATVAQGVHGRRRTGPGDSFWQFRQFAAGDPPARIDWRQSAKSGRPPPHGWFVREAEWEAAQTVFLWSDASASMRWKSRAAPAEKCARAGLLLLALASLLLRSGERVSLIEPGARPLAGRTGLDRLAAALAGANGGCSGLPPDVKLPRHAAVVLFGDFLSPPDGIRALAGRLAAVPVTAHMVQILDPAEVLLPYRGRIRFSGLEGEGTAMVPKAEAVRAEYARRLSAHREELAAACSAAGFSFALHRTDHPPEAALLALWTAISHGGRD